MAADEVSSRAFAPILSSGTVKRVTATLSSNRLNDKKENS